ERCCSVFICPSRALGMSARPATAMSGCPGRGSSDTRTLLRFRAPLTASEVGGLRASRLVQPQAGHSHTVHLFDSQLVRSNSESVARLGEASQTMSNPATDCRNSFFAQRFPHEFFQFV